MIATPTTLLQVVLSHDYFRGAFAACTVRARPGTDRACASLGLRLLQNGGQFSLRIAGAALDQLTTPAYARRLAARSLCWEIVPSSPRFADYTAVDCAGANSVLILTSTSASAAGGRLTAGTDAGETDVWPRQPPRFSFRPESPLRPGSSVTLQSAGGQVLRTLVVTDPNLLAVDTSADGAGLYQLVQGRTVLARWFADATVTLAPLVGPVLVLPGALLSAAVASLQTRRPSGAPPTYTANFPARAVVWRYHVFNATGQPGLSVQPLEASARRSSPAGAVQEPSAAEAPTTKFHPVPQALYPGAVSFEADAPLPLAAEAPQRFALRSGNTALCAPLPLAGFDFARSAVRAEIYSDLFVYLSPQPPFDPS